MLALHLPTAGDHPVLADVPTPTAGAGTVLVRVKAAALNPIDNAIAAGMLAQMGLPHEYPLVLGLDAAGVVVSVGADVDGVEVGDEVLGHVPLAPPIQAGTIAEYVVLPAATVTPKPAALDFVTAAAIPLAGATAAAAVDAIDPQPGQTVLVNGASGGVGSFALQLLSDRGATIVATGTPDDIDRLTELGAAHVVDFTAGQVTDQVRALYPEGVDALVNLAGFTAADVPLGAVKTAGKVSTTTGAPDDDAATAAGLTVAAVMGTATRDVVAPLVGLAATGSLKVAIDSVLPVSNVADGLATLAAGKATGKIVVTIEE